MLTLAIVVGAGYLIVVWKLDQGWERAEEQQKALRRVLAEQDERISKRLHELTQVIERIEERAFAIQSAVAPLNTEIKGDAADAVRREVEKDWDGRKRYFADKVLPD